MPLRAALCALAGVCTFLSAGPVSAQGDALRIGSKRFSESYLLGAILVRSAEAAGAKTEYREGLGNTAIVFAALRQGSIDLYPDYTGTIAAEILHQPAAAATLESINEGLRPLGIAAGIPFGFDDSYAIAMNGSLAQERGVTTISQLASLPRLRLGLSQEFLGRADGWPGLAQAYGLPQRPVALDHGLAYQALRSGQVDAIDAYSTDANLQRYALRILRDDRHFFPRYDAVVVYRADVPARFPRAWAAMAALSGAIDQRAMISMNAAVELEHRSFSSVAENFLAGHGQPGQRSRGLWTKVFGEDFWTLTAQHIRLVAVSVCLAFIIGVPLGVAAASSPTAGNVILALTAALQTIPALALLAMLIPLVGTIGTVPALIALFLYALLPIVRNACVALRDIPVGLRMAALALGLTRWQRLRFVEIPLATPVILAGVKTAAVWSVGTATIAAFIGAGGYGERISIGLALNDNEMLWAGAIPSALLAVTTQALFEAAEYWWRRRHAMTATSVDSRTP